MRWNNILFIYSVINEGEIGGEWASGHIVSMSVEVMPQYIQIFVDNGTTHENNRNHALHSTIFHAGKLLAVLMILNLSYITISKFSVFHIARERYDVALINHTLVCFIRLRTG